MAKALHTVFTSVYILFRILQQEMLSSEQLLKDFTEAQQLTVEELPVLESCLEKDRIMENRLSEQYQMAIEDSCSTYLMTTGVRNALAAASTVVQEVHHVMFRCISGHS